MRRNKSLLAGILTVILRGRAGSCAATVALTTGTLVLTATMAFAGPTYVNRGSSASNSSLDGQLTIVTPSGVASGDLMVAQVMIRRDGVTATPPAGWSLIRADDFTGNGLFQALYYKVAGSSEPGNFTWTFSATAHRAGAILNYRGANTASPIDSHSGQTNLVSTPITAPGITTTVADTTLVAFYAMRQASGLVTPPIGMMERWGFNNSAINVTIEIADQAFAGVGATGDRIATATKDDHTVGQFIAIAPAPSVCGNGAVESGEECDDGNTSSGDCCAGDCTFEAVTSPCSDDGNQCTDDECDGSGACLHPDNSDPCDDGEFCNGADTCSAGACSVHAGDPCPGADGDGDCSETCDEAADACTAPDPDGSACDDGTFCNGADVCGAGSCVPGPGDPCPGPDGDFDCAETCDEANDNCLGADPDGAACDDGTFCNGVDECALGSCAVHLGDPCLGGPQCADTCDEAFDTCDLPDGTPCDDGQWCTLTDECTAGVCSAPDSPCGSSPTCVDTCNETEQVCKGCGQPYSSTSCVPNAVVTLRAAVGLVPCELCLCDVDGSGAVEVSDALTILFGCIGALPAPDQCPEIASLLLWGGTTTTSTSLPFGSTTSTTSTTLSSIP